MIKFVFVCSRLFTLKNGCYGLIRIKTFQRHLKDFKFLSLSLSITSFFIAIFQFPAILALMEM